MRISDWSSDVCSSDLFSGTTCIELVQPTNDQPSIFREVLDRHGEGAVHHHYPKIRCLTAPEYDALCASYRTLGYEEALSFHLPGLGRNSFFDATADLGFFLEVLEVPDAAYEYMMGGMYRQHVQWDGQIGRASGRERGCQYG